MSFAMFMQHLLNGLTLGSLHALIAIGYTMVYGILRLINFAHSEVFMLGAYLVFWGITLVHLPWPLAMIVAILVVACVGVVVDRIRLIRVGDYDACPCIGPHVTTTGDIGRFRVISTSFENGVLRIRYKLTLSSHGS